MHAGMDGCRRQNYRCLAVKIPFFGEIKFSIAETKDICYNSYDWKKIRGKGSIMDQNTTISKTEQEGISFEVLMIYIRKVLKK